MLVSQARTLGLAAAVGFAVAVAAQGPAADAAGLLIADNGFGGVLTLEEHDVKVTINNGVAVTEVTQVFRNTEQRIVEALYTFPVPKGASVSNFSMWIQGKEMIGEVVEKKRAREIYESYKQTRRDPGLLEQVDYKTFEMRVFPIPAGAEQRVQVTYYQELDVDHDAATYVYPLATVTRAEIDQRTQGRFAVTVDVKNEAPIVELASPSHGEDVVTAAFGEHYRRASLELSGGDLSRDFVLHVGLKRPQTGVDLITSHRSGADGYFQLTFTAGAELDDAAGGMDYVFVLDISGSMASDSKLATSRRAVAAFIEQLDAEDRLEVIPFNVTPAPLFKSLRPADESAREGADDYLQTQRARGGTVLRPAIGAAYQYRDPDRPLNVVILSDGMTEHREQRELVELIRQRPANCRVFCIGVGNEVNRPLLSQLAEGAGGLASFISRGDYFDRQAKAFRRKLVHPVGTNLSIKFAGGGVYDVEPQELPNLFHGSPVRMYGRYRDSGAVVMHVEGEVMGAPFEQTVTVDLSEQDDANPEIERMWASHRVQRLLRDMRRDGESPGVVNEVVSLCEEYSVVSEYASFIVLENDAEYKRWKIERRNAARTDRDRAAQAQFRARLEQLRDESLAGLVPQRETHSFVSTDVKAAPSGASVPAVTAPQANRQPPAPRQGFDLPTRGSRSVSGGGGGALDPISAALLLGMGGAAAAARRARESTEA
ncbi:Vault protein inter-alpha-trypsin [Posidoniimonas corsicana]|uniref:Vault protein inter-alpha-trypsin n=1 Tax=Posidoniimonas corsicana TaxID=1938618 RepID=A0A5C5VC56_9BACT|nr:VIT and VWA domain-containing protein [Posidoniimonas corsicana]TWT35429.1 Vault protein inter-alpha-trypsin [Posidoniimonas corsicana]